MSGWILLLGLVVVSLGVIWATRLPPSVSVDLPDPPKVADDPIPDAEPIIQRMFGLWASPESHFWSDNLRVGPPVVARDEHVPHGPRVGEQAGWTRPYIGSKMRSSEWTETIRRIVVGSGVANPLDKSFASSGVLERAICGLFCASTAGQGPSETPVYDGGGTDNTSNVFIVGGNQNTESPNIWTGGNQNGALG